MKDRFCNIVKFLLNDKKSKYSLLFSLFGVLLSSLSVVGVTYSLWTDSAESGNNSISTGTISMRYVEDMSFASINNATPMTANEAYASNNYFPFQVVMEASGSTELNYEITITTRDTTTFNYDTDQKIRIGLKKENNIVTDAGFNIEGSQNNVNYTNGVIVGTLPTTGTTLTGNPQTIYKGTISSSGTETVHNFKLYLWLDSSAEPNSVSEKYALTINVNTGSSAPNYQRYTLTYTDTTGTGCTTKEVRKNVPWGELCTPTGPQGYTFQGWYTSQNGQGTEVTSSTTASSNQTVYAYYTEPQVPQTTEVYVVSDTTMNRGSALPNGVNGKSRADLAMADWSSLNTTARPYYLKHVLNSSNEIEESYVGFTIDDDIKTTLKSGCWNDACRTAIDNLVNGEYAIKGYDTTAYQTNVDTLKAAFNYTTQPSICTDYTTSFSCVVSGLTVIAYGGGRVNAGGGSCDCYVYSDGSSYCHCIGEQE